jgi:RHS repeat-associated protein
VDLGSVRQTLDDTGAALTASGLSFTPFGLPQSGAQPAPFGFTGELHHNDLVYLRARWYDPSSGTLLGRDPFEGYDTLPYSLHPYQYAYSAPTMWTDPSGELAIFIHGGGLFGDEDPTDYNPATNPMYAMADEFRQMGIVPGETVQSGPGAIIEMTRLVKETYDDSCGQEPIILVGYSRGGAAVQAILGDLVFRHPKVTVDLAVTVAPVHFNMLAISPDLIKTNVKKHINFVSEQEQAAFPSSDEV